MKRVKEHWPKITDLLQISTLKKRKQCSMVWNSFLHASEKIYSRPCKSLSCHKRPGLLKDDKTKQGMIWVKCLRRPCLGHALASCHRLFPVLWLGGEGVLQSLCLHLCSFWLLHPLPAPAWGCCPRGLTLCSRGKDSYHHLWRHFQAQQLSLWPAFGGDLLKESWNGW